MTARPRTDRQVIPRWRSYAETAALGELDPARAGENRHWVEQVGGRQRREWDFNRDGGRAYACDLIGSAVVLGVTPAAITAARLLLADARVSPLAHEVARRLVEQPPAESGPVAVKPRDAIGALRRRLTEQPRNAVRWADLARLHTINGNKDHARDAMRIALNLAPADRYVLRSAVRLAIHHHESERAYRILAGVPGSGTDPWLLAAEISSAEIAGLRSRRLRQARQMLDAGQCSPRSLTELASTVATVELHAGDERMARRLFRQALVEPTENTVAQAQWASTRLGTGLAADATQTVPRSWEARALTEVRAGNWQGAIDQAAYWQRDQPFSSRPAEFGSYHAARGGDFAAGAGFADLGLTANPTEFLLLNNSAFCLLSLGDVNGARGPLSRINVVALSRGQRSTYLATSGLLEYRSGRADAGRRLYLEAIELARDPANRALAAIMMAREELRARLPEATAAVARARELRLRSDDKELDSWLAQLEQPRRGVTFATPTPSWQASRAPKPRSQPDPCASAPRRR